MKSAAVFHRLDRFLATVPSTVARWSLLTRCVSGLTPVLEVPVQAMTAAELLEAPLDHPTLRLLRDTLKVEYARAQQEQSRDAEAIPCAVPTLQLDSHHSSGDPEAGHAPPDGIG